MIVAGAVGVLSQFGDNLPIWNEETATSAWSWITQFAIAAVVVVLAVGALGAWLVISVAGYVVQWWNFRLVREHGSLHLTSGLFTTRSITVEEAKVRGVVMTEPVLMRVVGGAELSTLATGVEDGVTQVLPPCPRVVAVGVGQDVLEHSGPLTDPLVAHGPRAHRRAWFRELREALVVIVAAAGATWWFDISWWWVVALSVVLLALAAVMGEASYRHLGHALADDHLVAGSGVLARIRTVLETDGIIGWVVNESWWQRRAGLADLVATTAAGNERVLVKDVRLDVAVALADRATPGLLTDFVDRPGRLPRTGPRTRTRTRPRTRPRACPAWSCHPRRAGRASVRPWAAPSRRSSGRRRACRRRSRRPSHPTATSCSSHIQAMTTWPVASR